MPHLLRVILVFALLFPTLSSAETSNSDVSSKIVNGNQSEEGNWPWMSALVYTYQEAITSLNVDKSHYETSAFSFGPEGKATGELIDCGIGDNTCPGATNKVCLIERGDINFSTKANNCENGGGIGVIIYNNVEGELNGTLGEDFIGQIPVVSVTKNDGQILQTKIGTTAIINVEITDLAQSSSCGASFLGDKWVLTAAHCVDGQQASQIKINVGEYNLADGAENATQVKRIYMHPDYNDANFNNDIALLELEKSVTGTAITLVDDYTTTINSQNNSDVTVLGWGGRVGYEPGEGPTSDFPDELHEVELQLLTNEQCLDQFNANYFISDAMICAYFPGGGKGSCQGDSGGPMVLNTNEGWQQVGIVSWGVGCASVGNPGVYVRVSQFIDWINSIKDGISIEQKHDFGVLAQNTQQSHELTVVNNTAISAEVTYSLSDERYFSLDTTDCSVMFAGETCQVTISYNANSAGSHQTTINMTSNHNELLLSSSKILGQTIAQSTVIADQMAINVNGVAWYSGGDTAWKSTTSANEVKSGVIGNNAESIVMMTFSGAGDLSFEWSVSSEENTDDALDPFDALYLYIDDVEVVFISGEVDFELKEFPIDEGDHKITWIYRKDSGTKEHDDAGYLRNVSFAPTNEVIAPEPEVSAPDAPVIDEVESSSGGSVSWLSLMLMFYVLRRKVLKA